MSGPASGSAARGMLITAGLAALALVAGLAALVTRGDVELPGTHTHAAPPSEISDHYLLEVILGDEHPIDAAHAVGVTADGLVAAAVDPSGDDRPRIVVTEGIHEPQDLSGTELLRRSTVHGLVIDRRGNVVTVTEHTRAGVTRRRAVQWGVFAGGPVRTLVDGVWDGEGAPVAETSRAAGRRPAISDAGIALALADITDGTGRASFRLIDPRQDHPDLTIDAPLDEDPLRPAIADDGRIVVSTGDSILTVETGIGRVETLAEAERGTRFGRAPGISADGRVVAFALETADGTEVHALRRDGEGWTGPTALDTRVSLEEVDEPVEVAHQRHPPEVGDVGLLLVRGTYAGSGEEGLWTAVLEPDGDDAFSVAEVRPVTLVGDTIDGRRVGEIVAGPDLTVPRRTIPGHPDAHWIAFAVSTDEGPMVIRGVPVGSGLEREARFPDHHEH